MELNSKEELPNPSTSSDLSSSSAEPNKVQDKEIQDLFEQLVKNSDIRIKSQQRNETDLSEDEKIKELNRIFFIAPATFLQRFGNYLNKNQLDLFRKFTSSSSENNSKFTKSSYDLNFYLDELEKNLSLDVRKMKAKNRRYQALNHLVDNTNYFSEEEMQRRNPILYDQLIGRFHTKLERIAFLNSSNKSTSSVDKTPIVDMFLAHLVREEGVGEDGQQYSLRRREQENALSAAADEDEEMDEDDDDGIQVKQNFLEDNAEEEIEDEEKELLKEEFFTTMYRSFLEGRDQDFDYSTVDDNPQYDIGETLDQDEEDKYFEAEEPTTDIKNICDDEDSSSSNNSSSKITNHHVKKITYAENQNEEDELDVFMRGIEVEVIGEQVGKL